VFAAPDFAVHVFADPREALLKLHEIGPDLILCSLDTPVMPGRSVMRVVKRSERLRGVPFVFLCADHTRDDIIDCLEDGADDFLTKPVDTPLLMAKLRATLRLANRLVTPDERGDAVTGDVDSAGGVRLLRFCEDFRLTGRLTIKSNGTSCWAEFSGGELVRAGQEPADQDTDALDSLLAMKSGTYRIEQKRIEADALRPKSQAPTITRVALQPMAPSDPDEAAARAPAGRLSLVESRGGSLQIQTEGENRPHFTVTTVVMRRGQVLRRIENGWEHALQRRGDELLAKRQIDEQHDQVVASLRDAAFEGTAGPLITE
jgi:CheY-like chemotaxis protein